jgi:hypothetical protein
MLALKDLTLRYHRLNAMRLRTKLSFPIMTPR